MLLAESARLGGTCVNVGCVPKKVMWNAANIAEAAADARYYGFDIEYRSHDWSALRHARDAYITRLNGIYERNLAAKNIEFVRNRASFVASHEIRIGDELFEAPRVVIATGGRPILPSIPGSEYGITSDGFFELDHLPSRTAIVGGGYIAVELAGVLQALGSKVTLAFRRDRVLRHFDSILSDTLMKIMRDEERLSLITLRRARWSAISTVRCGYCSMTVDRQVPSIR